MLRNCFVDKSGGVFKVESLLKAAKGLPITTYYINREALLDETLNWQIKNVYDFFVHFQKVIQADLSVPLIVRSDGYVMDGWHRIIRALCEGRKELPQKRFIKDPEPDETSQ